MLEPILQQVAAGNPQIAQLIGQNQEQFLQLLSEDIEGDGALPPGTHAISVTEEERDAIERVRTTCPGPGPRLLPSGLGYHNITLTVCQLCRLGFSRDSVIQAYFACDKNEELAANFLFEQPDEGDDQ